MRIFPNHLIQTKTGCRNKSAGCRTGSDMKAAACLISVLFGSLLLFPGCQKSHLNINETLPDFTFYDADGRPVRIYDYLSPEKRLLIHFWGASCCLEYSVPTMKAVTEIDQSGAYGHVTVVSVNLDYPQRKVQRIIKEMKISQPVLNDTDDLFYKKEPKLKNVFPLALILVVNDKGIITKKMMGPQLMPAIAELLDKPNNSS